MNVVNSNMQLQYTITGTTKQMLGFVAFVLSVVHIGDNHWLITKNNGAITFCHLLVRITTSRQSKQ